MGWISGPGDMPRYGGVWISTDAYDDPVYISDAEVRADNAEVERERVALDETCEFPPVERGLYEP